MFYKNFTSLFLIFLAVFLLFVSCYFLTINAQSDPCASTINGELIFEFCPYGPYSASIRNSVVNCWSSKGPASEYSWEEYVCVDCDTGSRYYSETDDGVCLKQCVVIEVKANSSCDGGFSNCYYETAGSCSDPSSPPPSSDSCSVAACKNKGFPSTQNASCDGEIKCSIILGKYNSSSCFDNTCECCADGAPSWDNVCGYKNLTYPNICTIGETFDIEYEYPTFMSESWWHGRVERRLQDGSWEEVDCDKESKSCVLAGIPCWWDSGIITVNCDSNLNIHSPNISLKCNANNTSIANWCLQGGEPAETTVSFFVRPIPVSVVSIGYVSVWDGAQVIKLNLISAADAIDAENGVVKVAKFDGDTNTAADLVNTSNPGASPVRIMTSVGVRSWRAQEP